MNKSVKSSFFRIAFAFSILIMIGCANKSANNHEIEKAEIIAVAQPQKPLDELSKAYFASGCFWCVEAIYESVNGVQEAVSGYSGGPEQNPTYREVASGSTGHTESVEVYYDPEVVSYETLVEVFYGSHDPTTVNGQHPDYGRQYRSAIFYQNDEEKEIAERWKKQVGESGEYDKPIATEISPLEKFWAAEEYHQDFEKKNPYQPYVRAVSIPRLRAFQAKYPQLLKADLSH
ncbi:MAG: peptide-methionine (S)-S-oxide reductase MsrA [Bacteroidota bacterium]